MLPRRPFYSRVHDWWSPCLFPALLEESDDMNSLANATWRASNPPLRYRLAWAVAVMGTLGALPATAADSFIGLGTLGGSTSYANGVSADGSVVVGIIDIGSNTAAAFRWSNGSMSALGTLGGSTTAAYGVSADGSTVVGSSDLAGGGFRATRWQGNVITNLGSLGGNSEAATASADGSVVAGWSDFATTFHAFRWTAEGGGTMTDLGSLAGAGGTSGAVGISADGSVVVGYSTAAAAPNVIRAFRWTTAPGPNGGGTMTDLGTLGGSSSAAYAVSYNGSVVVGQGDLANGASHAFRWGSGATDGVAGNHQMRDLGTLPGDTLSYAVGVSGDGKVVVGSSGAGTPNNPIQIKAFRWAATTGMQSVSSWLGTAGVNTGAWELTDATATNADGSVVVGQGINPATGNEEAYLARVSNIGSGIMNPGEYLKSVSGNTQTYLSGEYLASLALNGSHHRPLMSYAGLPGERCAWLTGDFGRYDEGRDADLGAGEAGICGDYLDNRLRAGIGIGQSYQWQDLPQSGKDRLDGQYLIGEADWRPSASAPIFSATALYGDWDAHVRRGYMNGIDTDHSSGDTTVRSAALRGRIDWIDAAQIGHFSLTPWASFTLYRTNVDGYTEDGGGFPAHFDSQKHTAREGRLGLTAATRITDLTTLRANAEAAHRFDDQGPSVSGQVLGLFSFSLPGTQVNQDWVRLGADVDHQLGKNTLVSFSLNAASTGQDPTVSGAVSLRMGF